MPTQAISATPLATGFAARIDGVDITRPIDAATWAEVRAAFDEHSVLLFRGQPLDDEAQVAFSQRFGALEVTRSMNPAAGTPFARQSNLDIKTGAVIPAEDRRMIYQLANMLWHTDSSFKTVPSLCSLLSARIIPPEGGATEFASARSAYPSLPAALKRRAEGLVVVHDFAWSRDQVRPGFFTDRERSIRRCATRSSASTRRTGAGRCSSAPTPRTSRGCRWRKAARSSRRCWSTSPSRSSAIGTSGRRATS
jgi:alpha-ketoglutarate-dependent 2,4-dichlorophenoxyacetate dioxygenase